MAYLQAESTSDYKGEEIMEFKQCTACQKEEAEWYFLDDAYCQLCWEAYCSEEWWKMVCGEGVVRQLARLEKKL